MLGLWRGSWSIHIACLLHHRAVDTTCSRRAMACAMQTPSRSAPRACCAAETIEGGKKEGRRRSDEVPRFHRRVALLGLQSSAGVALVWRRRPRRSVYQHEGEHRRGMEQTRGLDRARTWKRSGGLWGAMTLSDAHASDVMMRLLRSAQFFFACWNLEISEAVYSRAAEHICITDRCAGVLNLFLMTRLRQRLPGAFELFEFL